MLKLKRKLWIFVCFCLLSCKISLSWCYDTLILYDSSNQADWIGYLNSVFLANLLGHFFVDYKILPVEKYESMKDYNRVFYLGVLQHNVLPEKFVYDVLHSNIPVVWLGHNLEQLGAKESNFAITHGFYYHNFELNKFNEVVYNNVVLSKHKLDGSINVIQVVDENKLKIIAEIRDSLDKKKSIPYIVYSNNFWYVADVPFQYIDENNRYLAFTDLLYDILDIQVAPKKRAILRFEDVNPLTDPKKLKLFADYLSEKNIPFAVALTPVYRDPMGVYNKSLPLTVKLNDKPELIAALHYMTAKGGTIILHGYTHQYKNNINPYTAASGDDYEFLDVKLDESKYNTILSQPVADDSLQWVKNRVDLAEMELNAAGLSTSIWETPHYAASKLDNQFFAKHFLASIGRIRYYDKATTKYADQFFPYVIYKDVYGGKVLPENLGCVAPKPWFNFPVHTIDDVLYSASRNFVVRDSWASFCYHPFLGLEDLKKLVIGLEDLGYEFVNVSSYTL